MSVSQTPDPLAAALERLQRLGGEAERAALSDLRGRLRGRRLRVLVAGEAKRGKSTLVNALLGRPVLPMGVTPLTALATTVRHGRPEGVSVVHRDGREESLPLSALGDLVTERGNPGNRRGVASVAVTVDAPLLAHGAELVDTPGTGSVYAHNTAEAEAALDTMDAAVFVLTADPPVSASERTLMSEVAGLSVAMFVVLNKADYLAGRDLAEALEFTSAVVAQAAGGAANGDGATQAVGGGGGGRVYPVSARAALAGEGDEGFDAFADELAAYLRRRGSQDLRLSAAGHARRIAEALRDEALLARQASRMRGGEAADRVAAFAGRLAAVRERRQDAADLTAAESARMLADVNESAGEAAAAGTARVAAAMDSLLASELRSAPPGQIEREGRARLAGLAVAEAEAWRREQSTMLEGRLSALDERLTVALKAELDAVREAAARLLGLDLAVAGPGHRLAPDLRFFYQVAEEAGQTELLAGAIRRRIPGEAGRRRAREHLRRETADLVPQQIGRARADLQQRLAEASRRLTRAVQARYQESTGRLERALADAAGLRAAADEQVAAHDAELARRLGSLDDVLRLLDQAAPPRPQSAPAAGTWRTPLP